MKQDMIVILDLGSSDNTRLAREIRELGVYLSLIHISNKDLFEKADATKVQAIKEVIISQIDDFSTQGLKQEELGFLKNAKQRIMQLGTQLGQTKKIINAYHVLYNALDGSVENIFYLPEFKMCIRDSSYTVLQDDFFQCYAKSRI